MAARRAANHAIGTKSVHIRMQPRPANLTESREILRVLQRFGEITTYNHLRHEWHNPAPNVAVAIYRDVESARKAINASPIRFALEKISESEGAQTLADEQLDEEMHEDGPVMRTGPVQDGVDEILRPSTLMNRIAENRREYHASPPSTPSIHDPKQRALLPGQEYSLDYQADKEQLPSVKKWFHITVDVSNVVHQDYVERQPFWKQYSPTKSAMQNDLTKVVPHIGLSDVSKRPENHHRTPSRVLGMMARYIDKNTKTLRQVYEDGGNNKG